MKNKKWTTKLKKMLGNKIKIEQRPAKKDNMKWL